MLTVPGGASVACSTAKAIEWDAAWSNHLDPSGRAALGVHDYAYKRNLGPVASASKIVKNGPMMMDATNPQTHNLKSEFSGTKIKSQTFSSTPVYNKSIKT